MVVIYSSIVSAHIVGLTRLPTRFLPDIVIDTLISQPYLQSLKIDAATATIGHNMIAQVLTFGLSHCSMLSELYLHCSGCILTAEFGPLHASLLDL